MRCMGGCNTEGHIIKLTDNVEVSLCMDCAKIAKKWLPRQVLYLQMQDKRRVDVKG